MQLRKFNERPSNRAVAINVPRVRYVVEDIDKQTCWIHFANNHRLVVSVASSEAGGNKPDIGGPPRTLVARAIIAGWNSLPRR
jgi:hypothetical protein